MKQNKLTTIQDIENSLALCDELEKQCIVIPLIDIEKHFPAARHPAYPDTPSYNYGALKEWAKNKGWKVTPSTTGTTHDRSSVPAIRFSRIEKINPIPNPTANPTTDNANSVHDPWQKPLGKIAIGVAIIVLGVIAVYVIGNFMGITLN
jgi:hypothetical protein